MLFSPTTSKTGDANRSTRCTTLRNYIFLSCISWFNPHSHVWGQSLKEQSTKKVATLCVFLPTCPDEASRLMVVRSIQPRLASSLWFTSRNWTMARLASSEGTNTQTHERAVNVMESDSCWTIISYATNKSSWCAEMRPLDLCRLQRTSAGKTKSSSGKSRCR